MKKCEYYKEDKDYCPFDFSCNEECLFVYKRKAEFLDELTDEQNTYKQEIINKEWEINELEGEIADLQTEMADTERISEALFSLCKDLISLFSNPKSKEKLTETIQTHDLGYTMREELIEKLEESEDEII